MQPLEFAGKRADFPPARTSNDAALNLCSLTDHIQHGQDAGSSGRFVFAMANGLIAGSGPLPWAIDKVGLGNLPLLRNFSPTALTMDVAKLELSNAEKRANERLAEARQHAVKVEKTNIGVAKMIRRSENLLSNNPYIATPGTLGSLIADASHTIHRRRLEVLRTPLDELNVRDVKRLTMPIRGMVEPGFVFTTKEGRLLIDGIKAARAEAAAMRTAAVHQEWADLVKESSARVQQRGASNFWGTELRTIADARGQAIRNTAGLGAAERTLAVNAAVKKETLIWGSKTPWKADNVSIGANSGFLLAGAALAADYAGHYVIPQLGSRLLGTDAQAISPKKWCLEGPALSAVFLSKLSTPGKAAATIGIIGASQTLDYFSPIAPSEQYSKIMRPNMLEGALIAAAWNAPCRDLRARAIAVAGAYAIGRVYNIVSDWS
jgi:hypothetical protein